MTVEACLSSFDMGGWGWGHVPHQCCLWFGGVGFFIDCITPIFS